MYSGDNDPVSFTRGFFGIGEPSATRQGRALLSAGGSCGETPGWEKNGGIVGYFFGVFFMFLGIAIVCDDFFVVALEKICEVLRLSDDVAGATFMAAGSSAPELASSAISLINPNAGSEIGVGTIVGSAIFNILIIIGATVIATGNTLQLDWKPVTRDCFFYAAAIGGVVGTFAGGRVDWWEGAVYVALYASYILTMMYNVPLMRWMDSLERNDAVRSFKARLSFRSARNDALDGQRSERMEEYRAEQEKAAGTASPEPHDGSRSAKVLWGKIRDDIVKVPKHNFANVVLATAKEWKAKQAVIVQEGGARGDSQTNGDADVYVLTPTMTPGHIRAYRSEAVKAAKLLAARDKAVHERAAAIARAIEEGSIADEGEAASSGFPEPLDVEEDDSSSPWSVPEDKKEWLLWALSLPWYAAFQLTIPPCNKKRWEKFYILSFAMSIVWIGFITHWMVEWCVRIGCILKIPSVVMGTTVLAAGTSIPDALSSIAVARDGLADMAVANAVGSNVFDIWLGLGLPWAVYLPTRGDGDPRLMFEPVSTTQLWPSGCILAGVLFVYYASVAASGFALTRVHGIFFLFVYALFAAYSVYGVWRMDVYELENRRSTTSV